MHSAPSQAAETSNGGGETNLSAVAEKEVEGLTISGDFLGSFDDSLEHDEGGE